MRTDEELATLAINIGLGIHKELGPGLFESVYERVMASEIRKEGVLVERQVLVPIRYKNEIFDEGFRIDLLLDKRFLIEVKSVEKLAPVHMKQVLTYLRLADLRLGVVMNFGQALFKEGLHRVVNGHGPFVPSCLHVNSSRP